MDNKHDFSKVEKILRYRFKDKGLLKLALTHSSYANANNLVSNERIEFLGDTVLDLIITERIYADKDFPEGQLSRLRSRIVSEQPLAELCEKMGLSQYLITQGGTSKTPPSASMRADMMEALIGAIYLDGGLKHAKKFVIHHFNDIIQKSESLKVLEDYKTRLQEQFVNSSIRYVAKKSGSEHDPIFSVVVYVNKVASGKGVAGTKRKAEQIAASQALKNLTKV